jgi:2-iminobutanoate/2-iminopropanoate deaminase
VGSKPAFEKPLLETGAAFRVICGPEFTNPQTRQFTNMAHQIILTDQAPAPIGPYSQAVKAGNTVYVSGQIPLDANGQLVPGDIAAQTHQVLKNLTAILKAAGLTLADVVKCSIFVKDLGDFATINQVYGSYFDEATAPARETVEVARLPRDVQVEISCIAVGA